MAIHHVQVSSYSRSKGDNALAKAAYRTGSVMKDEASGEIWDFSKKKNVDFVEMIFPESQKEMDRQDFWNMAERIETRSNSNTCKELRFSLPIELSSPARLAMARKYVRKLVERYGFTADLAYHNERGNPHIHVLVNTRRWANGKYEKIRELDTSKSGEVERIRKEWAATVNAAFEAEGRPERIYASRAEEVAARGNEAETRLNVAEGLISEAKTDIEKQDQLLALRQIELVNQQNAVQQQHSTNEEQRYGQ